jgi:hypothetical protein
MYRKREWARCAHEHGGGCSHSIQRLEGSRSPLQRTRRYANWIEGRGDWRCTGDVRQRTAAERERGRVAEYPKVRRKDVREHGRRDLLGKKARREGASRGTQRFRDVDRRLMRRRHPGPVENEAGLRRPQIGVQTTAIARRQLPLSRASNQNSRSHQCPTRRSELPGWRK